MVVERLVRVNYASSPLCLTAANVARDFDRFHLPLDRLHNRLLHGPGILTGLELSIAADRLGIFVSAGAALDVQGRTIVLADAGFGLVDDPPVPMPVPVRVPLSAGSGAASQALTIEFSEEPSLPINPAEPAGCKQIEMRPRLRLLAANSPLGPDAVILGNVTIGDDGKVAAVGPASRSHSQVTTAGLTINRAGPENFATKVAATLKPDSGGLLVDVLDGSLKISADTTRIGTHTRNGDALALRVEGPLVVYGDVILGETTPGRPGAFIEPGDSTPRLRNILDELRNEIDALKQLLPTPALTTIWVHDSAARIVGAENSPSPAFQAAEYTSDSLRLLFRPNQSAELYTIIPAPSQVFGRTVKLRRVFILGTTSDEAEILRVEVDTHQQILFQQNLHLAHDFTIVASTNTFTLTNPWTVNGALAVMFRCQSLSNNPFLAGVINLIAIGAEFES